jgi:2,4-dienoyl-CoA reductase-like NADH-dependent reductase (Old Yellow Enzyme family)/thioredoxin reductase
MLGPNFGFENDRVWVVNVPVSVFSPITLGNVEIRNRIVFPSICAFFCEKNGMIGEREFRYVEERARSGVGLLIIPGSPHGTPGPGRPTLSDDAFISGWADLARMVHSHGAKLFVQLHPAKIQAGTHRGSQSVEMPDEFSLSYIDGLVRSYAACAARAKRAGVDGVEIHGAHAHEVALFLSPLYNKRSDGYGGSCENRARFPVAIIQAVKEVCGKDYPFIFRISGREMVDGGRELDETVELAAFLEQAGADAIHVSCGMPASSQYVSAPMDMPDCFNVENATAVKRAVKIPVIAVGRIVDVQQAADVIATGRADMVSMARALLCDPEIVNKYTGKNDMPPRRCVGCNQGCCTPFLYRDIRCTQNPRLGREAVLNFDPPPGRRAEKTRVMVAGAGPAGLEAACDLALRGFAPIVYERSESAGGLIGLAELPPSKSNIRSLIQDRLALASYLGIDIRYNQTVDLALVERERPDVLVAATGSEPAVPRVPGIEGCLTGDEVLRGAAVKGRRVALLGGGLIGCEVAEYLAEHGKDVVVFESLDAVAKNLGNSRKYFMLKRMAEKGVEIVVNARIDEIALPDVRVTAEGAFRTFGGFDAVVSAAGRRARNDLTSRIAMTFPDIKVLTVGDALRPGTAIEAISSAARAAAAL